MICQTCSTAIPEDSVFCKSCGAKIDNPSGATKVWSPPASLETTNIYEANRLAQTVLYTPPSVLEEREPIFGWLVVTAGKDAWKAFTLPDAERQFILGNGKEIFWQFVEGKLEERHASIRIKDSKIYITDLDTVSGTLVNGKEITRSDLQDGDEITIGETTLKFKKL